MSHDSSRSKRVKEEARTRPDAVWRDRGGEQSIRYQDSASVRTLILSGGTELARLVAEADSHLVAMRKIAR